MKRAAFAGLLDKAAPLFDVLIEREEQDRPTVTPEQRAALEARLFALVALIGDQADAPTMPMVKIEGHRTGGKCLRPFTSASMHERPLRHSSHVNTGSNAAPWAALKPVHR